MSFTCGSAAAQCGKALPFRRSPVSTIRGYASQTGGTASKLSLGRLGKAEPFRTVRRLSRCFFVLSVTDQLLINFERAISHISDIVKFTNSRKTVLAQLSRQLRRAIDLQ